MGYLYRYLDTNGDGTGTKQVTGDYSSARAIFKIQPPSSHIYRLARMIGFYQDTGTYDAEGYAALGALTNGIRCEVRDINGTVVDLFDGLPVKTNGHWKRLCFDGSPDSWGVGDGIYSFRWTFRKDLNEEPLVLDGSKGERLVMIFNDAFNLLVDQTFMVRGTFDTQGVTGDALLPIAEPA